MKNCGIRKRITGIFIVCLVMVVVFNIATIINEHNNVVRSEKALALIKSVENVKKNNIKNCIGYLNIPDTKVNYPIMQSSIKNPDFYLNHNINGDYSKYGVPYLSAYCNVNESDNLIIYAHNISGGKIFGELMKYKDRDFYKKHKFIHFTTYEKKMYEIIGVMSVNKYEFPYYKFVMAKDEEDFNKFVAEVKKNSIYDCNVEVAYGHQLITLSTCDSSRGRDYRFVVIGREKK